MRAETVRRCVKEMNTFLEVWENVQVAYVESVVNPNGKRYIDWLNAAPEIDKERDLLNKTSIRLSCALRDLRQGR